MRQPEQDLDKNELVQEHTASHIGKSDTCQYDQGTHQEALGPGFLDERIWLARRVCILTSRQHALSTIIQHVEIDVKGGDRFQAVRKWSSQMRTDETG